MRELISSTWELLSGLVTSVVDVFVLLFSWVFSVLHVLHVDHPRIEGLLIGVLFAYFYSHRDKNPWLRSLAAPLKIIIDIIDIVWDETLEALRDLFGDLKDKVGVPVSAVTTRAKSMWSGALGWLKNLRTKLSRKKL